MEEVTQSISFLRLQSLLEGETQDPPLLQQLHAAGDVLVLQKVAFVGELDLDADGVQRLLLQTLEVLVQMRGPAHQDRELGTLTGF